MSPLDRLPRRLTHRRSKIGLRLTTRSISPGADDAALDSTSTRSKDDRLAIRKAKRRLASYVPTGKLDKKLTPCLNAFLRRLPRDGARAVAEGIMNCGNDDEKLHDVFYNLYFNILLPMKAVSRQELPSASPQPKDLEEDMDRKGEQMAKACHFRDTCFERDGHTCPVTRAMDVDEWRRMGHHKGQIRSRVEAAYIIPLTYEYWYSADLPDYISQRWATLHQCFPDLRQTNLSSTNLRDPSNGLCLEETLHLDFNMFKLAFQQTGPNSYRVKSFHKFSGLKRLFSRSHIIKYNPSQDTQDLAPPDPQLLAVHLTIAEILCDSGLGDDIDRTLTDLEEVSEYGFPRAGRPDAGHLLTVAIGTV